MAEARHVFEGYIDLAARVAPDRAETDEALAAFMTGLGIPELQGCEQKIIGRAVAEEAPVVLEALQGTVPTDRKVTPFPSDSSQLRNDPIEGWYLTELIGSPYFRVQNTAEERRGDPLPAMLGQDGRIYMYERRVASTDSSIDGFVRHRYVYETSSPVNDRALLFAYALRVSMPRIG